LTAPAAAVGVARAGAGGWGAPRVGW